MEDSNEREQIRLLKERYDASQQRVTRLLRRSAAYHRLDHLHMARGSSKSSHSASQSPQT